MTCDAELFDAMKQELFSAVLSDALDRMGARTQVMRTDIRPLFQDAVVVGRAMTILSVDVYAIPESPYRLELEAVDALKPGDVFVAQTNGSTRSSLWGELLTTAAMARGARGAVIDGLTRDSLPIIKMGFPVFVRGMAPFDSKGRSEVIAYNEPIECGGAPVNPGDIVFADHDGIVVIPRSMEDAVISAAFEKVHGERTVRQALESGMSATEAFRRYGIL